MLRALRHLALAAVAVTASLSPLATPAEAAVGAPDSFGYVWYDNLSSCSTAVPAFGAGAVTTLDRAPGSMLGPVAMGFTMPFYGLPVSQIWISPAGYVTFSAQPSTMTSQALPTAGAPNHLIAVYWATCVESDITYEALPGQFHVRWVMTLVAGSDMEFHLWLNADGTFRMYWQSSWTWPATVGFENSAGTVGRTCFRDPTSAAGDETRETGFPTPRSRVSACFQPPVLLDCASARPATCGSNIASSLPAADAAPASVYSCTPTAYLGNEQVFAVTVPSPQRMSVSISNPALDLFRVGTAPCSESNCLQLSATDRIDIPIAFPGTYNFVVDKVAAGGGDAFSFLVECSEPYTPIDCGGSLAGNTSGGAGIFSTYSCAGPALTGAEALYSFTNPAQQNVAVTLQTAVSDLWVIIYDRLSFEAQGACLAAGRGGAGIFDAPAGDYVIVVDGANGATGAFQVEVDCGQLLDCARQIEISCSDVVNGNTSTSARDVAIYACVAEALTGGEDIYHFYNPIEQTLEARFLSQVPGQRMLLMPDTCNEADCLLTGVSGVSCALFPPGGYYLIIDGTSSGAYSFQLTCSDVFVGVDLRPTAIDASPLRGDCRTFDVAGTTQVAVTNLGDGTVNPPVEVVVFEDTNVDAAYTLGIDNVLGTANVATAIGPGATVFVDVSCAGTVAFRDNVIFATVDPSNTVFEVNELNNLFDTGRACEYRPPVGAFNPTLEWEWLGAEVDTVPIVGDVNGDTIPDVVFVTGTAQFLADGILVCVSGDTGAPIWSATAANARVWSSSNPAMGDIDGDGRPEIITESGATANTLVAIDDDGTLLWTSQAFIDIPARSNGGGGASIADINCDGLPEIVWGHNVFDVAGNHFWTPAPGGTRGANGGADAVISVAVDVDGDGTLEVVAGPTCYKWNSATGTGDILWQNTNVPDGWPAVGNFDDDPAPEIAITASGVVYLLEGDTGARIWERAIPIAGPFEPGSFCTSTGAAGGPPTIADFDGDCAAEVGVAGSNLYTVLETDGTVKWTAFSNDCSSNRTASSVFDFEGDGAAEVVYMDETYLHILRGTTGDEIPPIAPFDTRIVGLINAADPTSARIRAASHTWTEMISIADVDGDNNAEIIMPMNPPFSDPEPGAPRSTMSGIRVIGDADDNWVNTRRIWNQHAYHISNVLEDSRIPGPATSGTCEPDSWRLHNTYRDQLGSGIYTAPDITISITRADVELITCDRQYVIEARLGNGGGIGVGRTFFARFYLEDSFGVRTELASQVIPDLRPGEYQDFQIILPNPRVGTVTIVAVADDDGIGGSDVSECREDNNECSVQITNSPNPIDPPDPVGDDVLRATAHSNPYGDPVIGEFNWLLDRGQPRPVGDHFHVYRSTDPTALVMLTGIEPQTALTYSDPTPLSPLNTLPVVHYYKVFAADECEQEELR